MKKFKLVFLMGGLLPASTVCPNLKMGLAVTVGAATVGFLGFKDLQRKSALEKEQLVRDIEESKKKIGKIPDKYMEAHNTKQPLSDRYQILISCIKLNAENISLLEKAIEVGVFNNDEPKHSQLKADYEEAKKGREKLKKFDQEYKKHLKNNWEFIILK